MENKFSKKLVDIYKRCFRKNETRKETEKNFEKYCKDTATRRKYPPDQK